MEGLGGSTRWRRWINERVRRYRHLFDEWDFMEDGRPWMCAEGIRKWPKGEGVAARWIVWKNEPEKEKETVEGEQKDWRILGIDITIVEDWACARHD